MNFSLQEQTIIKHFKQLLQLQKDPKRQKQLVFQLQLVVEHNLKEEKRQQARLRYNRRKEIELAERDNIELIGKLTIAPGDIIKVSGTQGAGMREVIGVQNGRIKCYELHSNKPFRGGSWYKNIYPPTLSNYIRSGTITTNNLCKLTHIAVNGEWQSIKKSN